MIFCVFGGRFFTSIMPPPKDGAGNSNFRAKLAQISKKRHFRAKIRHFRNLRRFCPFLDPILGFPAPSWGGHRKFSLIFRTQDGGGIVKKNISPPILGGGIAKNWSKFFECHQNATNLGGNFCLLTQLHFGGGKVISVPPPIFGGESHLWSSVGERSYFNYARMSAV